MLPPVLIVQSRFGSVVTNESLDGPVRAMDVSPWYTRKYAPVITQLLDLVMAIRLKSSTRAVRSPFTKHPIPFATL